MTNPAEWRQLWSSPLFYLSLALSLAFWPDTPGAAIAPKYALLYVALPASLFWLRLRLNTINVLGVVLIAWAAASFLWTGSKLDGIDEIAKLVLVIGCAFLIGQETTDLRPAYLGLAIGLVASSGVSIAQYMGFNPVVTGDFQPHVTPPGLWVNPNTQAEISVPVFAAALMSFHWRRWWPLLVGMLPAAFFGHARGPLIGLALAAFVWCVSRWRFKAVLALVPIGLALLFAAPDKWRDGHSLDEHVAIWSDTIDGVSAWGRGIGSFYTLFPEHATREDTSRARPDHAHSDPLELLFELGWPGAVLCAALFLACLFGAAETERLVIICLAVEAATGFPLHNAGTQYLFGLVAGHAARGWHRLRDDQSDGRMALRAGLPGA